jgi:hypothetical protein
MTGVESAFDYCFFIQFINAGKLFAALFKRYALLSYPQKYVAMISIIYFAHNIVFKSLPSFAIGSDFVVFFPDRIGRFTLLSDHIGSDLE